jgi:hypothetical protein
MLFRQWTEFGVTAPFWQFAVIVAAVLSAAMLSGWGIRRALQHNRAELEMEAAGAAEGWKHDVKPAPAAPARPASTDHLYAVVPTIRPPASPDAPVMDSRPGDTPRDGRGGPQGQPGSPDVDLRWESWLERRQRALDELEAIERDYPAFMAWLEADRAAEARSVAAFDDYLASGELERCDWIRCAEAA